ncbi:MAG: molecular chaperone TorD family protein [Alphaproteobacteria bacterium]|nr:molecular chaperone TorD family protein [Alphaproteobacteria bacterium]
MSEPSLSRLLAAAAALLLHPPDASTLAVLAESNGIEIDPAQAKQDFYDVLCVPQSGRYIPSYAHVLAQGRVRDGNWWHFPPPRFDGGDALARWYDAVGFDTLQLDADPMLKGPHRPLDQIGFVLAYLAGLVASRETGTTDKATADAIIAGFLTEHVGAWLDRFCNLLGGSGSPYLEAVANAVLEALLMARADFPAPVVETTSAEVSYARPEVIQP